MNMFLLMLTVFVLCDFTQSNLENILESAPDEMERINELEFQVVDRTTGKYISQEKYQNIGLIELKIDSIKEVDRILRESRFRSKKIKFVFYYAPINILPDSFLRKNSIRDYIGINSVNGYPQIDESNFYTRSYPWLAFEKRSNSLTVHIDATYHRFILDASINQEAEKEFLTDVYPSEGCLIEFQDTYTNLNRLEKEDRRSSQVPDCMPENFKVPFLDFYYGLWPKKGFAAFRPNGLWRKCAHKAEKQYRERYIEITHDFIQKQKSKTIFPRITCDL